MLFPQHLNCSTRAGRPPAQLSWYTYITYFITILTNLTKTILTMMINIEIITVRRYRGSEMMDSHYTVDGDTVSAVITFVPSHTNNEELTCEASNEALSEPIRNTITINITKIIIIMMMMIIRNTIIINIITIILLLIIMMMIIRNTITIQPSTTSSSSSSQPSTTTMKSSSTGSWVKLDMEHQAGLIFYNKISNVT